MVNGSSLVKFSGLFGDFIRENTALCGRYSKHQTSKAGYQLGGVIHGRISTTHTTEDVHSKATWGMTRKPQGLHSFAETFVSHFTFFWSRTCQSERGGPRR